MGLKIFQVDAFTAVPFKGNPAGVCLLDQAMPDEWMQAVAAEMNLSETAFLLKEGDGYRLRWMTPTVEVELCGHATLASAHILFEQGLLGENGEARFYTRSGLLTARWRKPWIVLNFPSEPVKAEEPPAGMLAALGVRQALFTGRNRLYHLVEVENEDLVRNLKPDFSALYAIRQVTGVIITSRGTTPGFDFISRFFAPDVGVNEDPVTGSAHCGLAPYWEERLGKKEMMAFQASARGGVLRVTCLGERVAIEGQACTVISGNLLV